MRKAIVLLMLAAMLVLPARVWAGDYPGACLAVNNRTEYTYDIRITNPSIYDELTWTVEAGESLTFTIEDNAIHTKTGEWYVRWTGPSGDRVRDTWDYRADRTFRGQCPAGTCFFTLSF